MNILQYDLDNYDVEDVEEVVRYLNHHGFKTVAIPRNFTLLLDVDSYTLHILKQKLKTQFEKKKLSKDKFEISLNLCYNIYTIMKGEENG